MTFRRPHSWRIWVVSAAVWLCSWSALAVQAVTITLPLDEIVRPQPGAPNPDQALRTVLARKLQEELTKIGFGGVGVPLSAEVPLDPFTQDLATVCPVPLPKTAHTDPVVAHLSLDGQSSLNVDLPSLRSLTLDVNLRGRFHAEPNAWVQWGQAIPFVSDCEKITTDHGKVAVDIPFAAQLSIQLDLTPSYDAQQVALVLDVRAAVSGSMTVEGGSITPDFGGISLTDPVINVFEDYLLKKLSQEAPGAFAAALSRLNNRLDGLNPAGEPDPALDAFNRRYVFVLDDDEADRLQLGAILQDLGVPPLVLDLLDRRGVEILLQLAVLDEVGRAALLAELGSGLGCAALRQRFEVAMPQVPLYVSDGLRCTVADAAAPQAASYFSDGACSRAVSFRPTSVEQFCAERLSSASRVTLGNAAAWQPELNQPGNELPAVPSRPWTTLLSTRMDAGVVSIAGNHQPYTKQLLYKSVPASAGSGTCALEMRVYKKDVAAMGLRPILAFHGGTWTHRGFSFFGLEATVSHLTERGFVVFAPFYRLVDARDGNAECNAVTWREVVADAEDALRWVQSNGVALGAAPGKVSVFGQSAGGHLAAWLAAYRPADVRKALLYYPPLDVFEFLAGAAQDAGPYVAYRDFGYTALARLLGATPSSVRWDAIDFLRATPPTLREEWAARVPVEALDLVAASPGTVPAFARACVADLGLDSSAVQWSAPPQALLDCLRRDLAQFIAANSLFEPLAAAKVPVALVHGSVDTLVPVQQAVALCSAVDGRDLPADVSLPHTALSCGSSSEAHLVQGAEHALDLGFCAGPLCPAGPPNSSTREATREALESSLVWLMADPAPAPAEAPASPAPRSAAPAAAQQAAVGGGSLAPLWLCWLCLWACGVGWRSASAQGHAWRV